MENVKAAYVDRDVDLDAIFSTGVNSMLSLLDPYSTYENADQAEDLAMRTTGRYGGVGLTIGKDGDDDILVLGALEGFAFDAGVRPGDRIKAVDGKPVAELSVDAVKSLLRLCGSSPCCRRWDATLLLRLLALPRHAAAVAAVITRNLRHGSLRSCTLVECIEM